MRKIRSKSRVAAITEFERDVRALTCLMTPPTGDALPNVDAEGRPKNMGVSYNWPTCPHCRALEIIENLKQGLPLRSH